MKTRRKVAFKIHADKTTSAEVCNNTPTQVTNSYWALFPLMNHLRTFVITRARTGNSPTVQEVRRHLGKNELTKAAADSDLKELIEDFSQRNPSRAKSRTLTFLERKTSLSRKTLKTYFTKTKKGQ